MLVVLIALIFVQLVACGKVIKLTNNNHDEAISKEPLVLVNYFAPWCAHCKKLNTELNEVAEDLVEFHIPARIASMDVSNPAHTAIAERVGVDGYPTLLVYQHGVRVAEYHGGRTHRDIYYYLEQKAKPRLQRLQRLADLAPILAQFERGELQAGGFFSVVLGAFTRPVEESAVNGISGSYAALFNSTAMSFDLALFFITDEPAVLEELSIKEDSMLVFQEFLDSEHQVFPFDGSMTQASVMNYLLHEALPLTVPYGAQTLSTIAYHPVKSQVLMFTDTMDNADPFLARMEEVALRYKGRLLFVEVAPEEYQLLSYFGITKDILPQIIVVNMTDADDLRRHHFSDYLQSTKAKTAQAKFLEATSAPREPLDFVECFLDAYLAGQLPRKLSSEGQAEMDKLNEHPMGGYVENIPGSSFEDKVMGEYAHNSLVYFHAPWCAHCKSIEPVISEVGKYYLEDPHFVVFRIDGTKNDVVHPKIRVVGYPTLYFFVGGDKGNPIEYDGDRTVEAIVDFIQNFRTAYAEVDESVTETEAVAVAAAAEGGTEGASEDLAARALAESESQESQGDQVVSAEQEREESLDDASDSVAAGGADTGGGVLAEEL